MKNRFLTNNTELTFLEKLRENVAVSFWEKKDEDHTVVRLATSWSTTKEDLEVLDQALSKMAF